MKGAFSFDGKYYLLRQLPDKVTITVSQVEGLKITPIVNFPSWKKSVWLVPIDEEIQVKITNVVDGYRRMARFAKIGFLFNG